MSDRVSSKAGLAEANKKSSAKSANSQNYLDKNDPLYKPLIKQEQLINDSFSLGLDANTIAQRASLAKYAYDIHLNVFNDPPLLFEPDLTEINPINAIKKIIALVERCVQISELATTSSPLCTYDLISCCFKEMETLLVLQDATFNQNFVLIIRIVAEAQGRNDLTAIADIFYGEIQALLKNFAARLNQSLNRCS